MEALVVPQRVVDVTVSPPGVTDDRHPLGLERESDVAFVHTLTDAPYRLQ